MEKQSNLMFLNTEMQKKLKAIPLAIAGWCRYLLGVDDNGENLKRSSDPMLCELTDILKEIEVGKPETIRDNLKQFFLTKIYLAVISV